MGLGKKYSQLERDKTIGEISEHELPPSPTSGQDAPPIPKEAEKESTDERIPTVFQEVLWNEYCVLFPDGTHAAFNDEVRYTNLKGYLRKRRVVEQGRAEFALQYGEEPRGWHRHFLYLNMRIFAWFYVDPDEDKGSTWSKWKAELLQRGKDVGSIKLDQQVRPDRLALPLSTPSTCLSSAPAAARPLSARAASDPLVQVCKVYVNRLKPSEFAVSYDNQLLMLQAASREDAHEWVVAIASCLYFLSPQFEELIGDCVRFFNAVPKSYDDNKLSIIEALDLLRAMGRDATLEQVEKCAAITMPPGRFDAREFAFLVRYVCSDVDPAGELLRAFKTFDPANLGYVSADNLINGLVQCGVPPEEVESIMRATGATPEGLIDYGVVVHSLYPNSIIFEERKDDDVASATGSQGGGSNSSKATPKVATLSSRRDSADASAPPPVDDADMSATEKLVRERQSKAAKDKSRRASREREELLRDEERAALEEHLAANPGLERQASSTDSLTHGAGPVGVAACARCAAATPTVPTLGLSGGSGADVDAAGSPQGQGGVMRTASGEFAATPRSAAINADINANMGQGAPTPRTYAGRLDRARSGRGESLVDVTDTPGKRPLNPGPDEAAAAVGGGQLHRL